MELVPQRTTPNVTVDFAMETSSGPMEQNQWQASSSTDLSVPSFPRSRSNSCGTVEQLPLEELGYSQAHVLSVDTNLQRVCKALEDGLRLNVPQASQHHGQLPSGDDEDDDCFVVGRSQSAMSSRMLQERRLSARTGSGNAASSHHNRSQSVRVPKRPTYLSPPHSLRPRGTSFPGGGSEEDCYLLRHFIVNGKNVVNRGDSFRNRKTTRSSATSTSSARLVLFLLFCCWYFFGFCFLFFFCFHCSLYQRRVHGNDAPPAAASKPPARHSINENYSRNQGHKSNYRLSSEKPHLQHQQKTSATVYNNCNSQILSNITAITGDRPRPSTEW